MSEYKSLPPGEPEKPEEHSAYDDQPPTGENVQPSVDGQSQISNTKSETETMEVHHPHHVTHKKKWHEYLLEFFMLFLAVFLGFIAENIREYYVERHREEAFIKSLVQNLKDDTTTIHWVVEGLERKISKMDTLVRLSKMDLKDPANLKLLTGIYLQHGISYYNFKSNNSTLSQLKAGSFRLIQKDFVADSIARYDHINTYTEMQSNLLMEFHNNFIYSGEHVFDYTLVTDTALVKDLVLTGATPPPLTSDLEKLKVFFNKAVSIIVASRYYVMDIKELQKQAKRLIALLQEKYHLEKN